MIAFFAHQIDHLKTKVYWTISTCNVEQDLYCGESIRGDDVLRTPPVILSLPGVLVVGHTAVRVQGHIVCQVLAIAHLNGGTIDNKNVQKTKMFQRQKSDID